MSLAKSLSTTFRETNLLRSVVLPVLVATTALAVAVIGALMIRGDGGIDGVNGFVEILSGRSGAFLGGLAGASFLFLSRLEPRRRGAPWTGAFAGARDRVYAGAEHARRLHAWSDQT